MSNDKKYTDEEIKAIVDEELSPDKLESVSGGAFIPQTHDEIDNYWDLVQHVYDKHDITTAAIFAYKIGLVDSEGDLIDKGIVELRTKMHSELDGGK